MIRRHAIGYMFYGIRSEPFSPACETCFADIRIRVHEVVNARECARKRTRDCKTALLHALVDPLHLVNHNVGR